MLVKYSELLNVENVKLLLSLKPYGNRYVLISDLENTYKLFEWLKDCSCCYKSELYTL